MVFWSRTPRGDKALTPSAAPVFTSVVPPQNAALPPHEASRLVYKAHDDSKIGFALKTEAGQTTVDQITAGSPADEAGLVVGDVVHYINNFRVETASIGCTLLVTAPPGFVEIVVTSTAPAKPVPHKGEYMPSKSPFDNEIEVLPTKSVGAPPSYETELSELAAMGFSDIPAALHALRACNGDVQGAVERLLMGAP